MIQRVITLIKNLVRIAMHQFAHLLLTLSGGKLSPDAVTLVGFAVHFPIALLIATRHNVWAAVLLIIFGLFDTLDGELARLQKRASVHGMMLDASTDRMKEVLLYSGAGYLLASSHNPKEAVWAVIACGAALCVSYVKAKGEAAVASGSKKIPHAVLNRMFADGFFTFEIRMAALVLGLLTNRVLWAMIIIAVFASWTAVQRLIRVSRQL